MNAVVRELVKDKATYEKDEKFKTVTMTESGSQQVEDMLRTADSVGLFSFVRVSRHEDESDIHRALEAGAGGIFLPLVRSAEDIQHAENAAFFPPMGTRGVCPSFRAARYNWRDFEQYARRNNEEALLVPMIERA